MLYRNIINDNVNNNPAIQFLNKLAQINVKNQFAKEFRHFPKFG